MERREEELIQRYAEHDAELRALYVEHQAFKLQLDEYRSKLYLTNTEEIEMKRLQKMKLASKDRMME
ncbi:MAG: DUF465 domain-containing protein, partial [Candidatus Binataceae bacterium]